MRGRIDGEAGGLLARRAVGDRHLRRGRLGVRPLLSRSTGHEAHIGACFARQIASTDQPVVNTPRSGVVGGRRKSEISELLPQVAQELRRFRDRIDRVEGICKPTLARGSGHELGHA